MTPQERRKLSRELSALAGASVADALRFDVGCGRACPVVGVTGPPGAGKSTLIGKLAKARLSTQSSLAIVAIDPSSALSGGAILGDRIRMMELADDPRVYIRSLATRTSRDGLTDNLPLMLERITLAGFDEILLETVGVGQVEYAVRWLAETLILVLSPGGGDQIQAMKSGIVEMPDIIVVNKADQSGAERMVTDLETIIARRRHTPGAWAPPVLKVRIDDDRSIQCLSESIDAHRREFAEKQRVERVRGQRKQVVAALFARRIEEVFGELRPDEIDQPSAELFAVVARRVVTDGPSSA